MPSKNTFRSVSCRCGIVGERAGEQLQVREPIMRPPWHGQRCTNEEPCAVKRILFAWAGRFGKGNSQWTIEQHPEERA